MDESDRLAQFVTDERLNRIDQILSDRTAALTIVLDRIQNHHNISAIIRSADAFGVSEAHLVGSNFEYSPAVSQGTERWVRLQRHESASEAIRHLKKRGFLLATLKPQSIPGRETSEPLDRSAPECPVTSLPFDKKLALVFGSEAEGVDEAFSKAADLHAYIPMYGFVESLNVSVACAICLFCSTIAETSPTRRTAGLSENQRGSLRAEWLKQSVRGADLILRELAVRKDLNK